MSNSVFASGGYAGAAWFQTPGSDYNALDFLVRQIIAGKAFTALVQVAAVHGGGTGAAPTVDVQPMVGQVDGFGNIVPHGVIYGLPCHRYQGGSSAVIIDPVAGDIGLALICDRDISTAKATHAVGGPGSFRQNDWADGCYLGGFLGGAPSQFVWLNAGGVEISTPGTLTVNAGGNVAITTPGSITLSGTTGVFVEGRNFLTHEHSGVQTGGGNTGGVV